MSNKNKNQQKRFRPKYKLKKGDTVLILTGNDKGSTGRVLLIDAQKGRAIVEGVRIMKRHTKPNAEYTNGGIISKEAPIDMSNLMLVDPKSGEGTRVGRKVQDGKIVRYSKKSGEVLS